MTWHGILEHDAIVDQFRRALARGRLASTFLFVGPEGVGKRMFALKLAQSLLCERVPEAQLDPCEACPACLQVLAGTHPDLELVARPEGRSGLLVEQFIGTLEKRGQEGMCHNLARRPMMGTRRVAIIDDADTLEGEAANCLLKLLEEPPPRSVLILIGTSPQMQLPTIRSRCQIVRFAPLRREAVAELLLKHGLAADGPEAERLARYAEGSLTRAAELADSALWDFRRKLLEGLAAPTVASVRLAQQVTAFVDEAGTEAPPRRARARQVIGFAAEFYRQLARSLSGASAADDDELRAYVHRAAAAWPGDAETAADCAARCLEALEHVDRNANLSNVLDCWIDEVARPAALVGRT
jgi:DNA polymerase-3 subunit delta'